MARLDPIIFRELPMIEKIIQDETWLEGERRGCPVTRDDPLVRENVCQIILRIGQQMRDTLMVQIAAEPGPAMAASHEPQHDQAA